ncbi:hypothetical protein M569_01512, partial [Genlisea aurea]
MAATYPLPVTAAQVGTYFVGQYYQMLQTQPNFAHQFYNETSTLLRIDANTRETATGMLQIHELLMSLNYAGIEIKTVNSLESWNNGILVVVSGSVRLKEFNGRKFIETFFLAPQEKGYFILNDMFHSIDEEKVAPHPVAYMHERNLDSKLQVSVSFPEQASKYILEGDFQTRDYPPEEEIEKDIQPDDYRYSEEQIKQVPETKNSVDDSFAVQSDGSVQGTVNSLSDHVSSPVQEPLAEPQKHTYASILQVSKGQSQPTKLAAAPQSEWQQIPEPANYPFDVPNPMEGSYVEFPEESSPFDDDVEVKSVYVRNVPTSMSGSEIHDEFKKFGKLRPDGVAIRTRKDIDVCYAFVEFEDASGVQNAIKASVVQIGGHQLYIEGRRLNRNAAMHRGRGRGRGGGGRMEGTRGGRFRGRGGDDRGDYSYNRAAAPARGNGFYR